MGKTLGYGEITVANVTEPFTVMLTNEAQQFATDSNRKVTSAQSYYTDIIVIRGSQERTDYTIGNITSGSGITVSKNSKRVTFSVSAGTTIGADAGVIEIPITLDGQTVKKQFSWSCGKQGPQGVKGNDGNSFAWNMLSETNCGKKHWGTESSGGKYSVEDFITEDNIDAVKLICTEGISTSNWSYVLFKDIKMLKQLKPSTKYTLSYDIKANRSGAISHSICKGDVSNFCTNTVVVNNIIGNETWQHISVVLTTNDLKTTPTNEILYLGRNALSKVGYSIIKNLKLVEGDIDTPWSPSQSDIEGKGVVETVQYYLATSQASGVTSSTSGWSTDITTQKLTADKKYLWNCYQTKYSDGTSEPISTPKVIGVYGDKGQKGDSGEDGQDGAGFHWNLLKYSGDLSKQVLGGAGTYTATVESIEDKTTPSGQAEKITYTVQGTGGKFIQTGKYIKEGDIKQGKTYTVSVWCKCSSIKSTGVINAEFLDNKTYVNPTLSTEWQQYVVTGVANKDVTSTSSASAISFYYSDNMSVGDIFYISSPKVEEGDKASPWCTTYEETLAKNLSITPSSQYFKSTDGGKTFAPNAITIKPTIQGEISFGKWQYSIDGGVSFADVVSGQKGLTVSNNVLTVSKDSSLYSDAVTMVTFRAVANDSSFYDTCSIAKIYDVSDIGDGRNLIQKSQLVPIDSTDLNLDDYSKNGTVVFINKSVNSGFSFDKYNNYQSNSKYVLSYYFTKTSGTINSFGGFHNGKRVVYTSFFVDDKVYDTASYAGGSSQIGTILNDGKRHRIVVCYTTPDTIATDTSVNYTFIQPGRGNTNPNFGVKIEELKLEKGSSPTGWSAAPEDLQTAILSTKSEISDVSLKVDKNKQAIEQRVEKTTYEQDLNLVKGDISKANEGLNKWRYEIYPKSLFASEYQGKSTMDVFAKNTNLTPSQSVLINDMDLSIAWNYDNNYIGYALTFAKFSAAKSVAITFAHDDGAHIYLNGKLIGGSDAYSQTGESLTLGFVKGWNCIEVVVNEGASTEGFKLGTTISAISECQLMNCYYGTPVARQSHITNQLVQNTTDIDGVSGSVQKVMSTVGGSGKIDEFVSNYATWKKKVDGIETRVGETYTTKDDFDDLQIGGRNLLKHSSMIGEKLICDNYFICNNCNIQEYTNDGFHIITPTEGNANNGIAFAFDNFTIMEINGGDTITFSCDIKGTSDSHAPFVSIHISDNNWYGSGVVQKNTDVSITKDWQRVSVTITTPTGLTKNHMWLAIHGNHQSDLYVRNFKLEKGNKPTDWTPAPEDVNGKIVNVETIANQTANKFQWIVKGGDSSSNFTLTDRVADLVAERINFNGLVTFSGTTNLIENSNMMNGLANITSECKAIKVIDDSTYRKALVITPIAGGRIFWGVANVWKANITYTVSFVAKSSVAGQKIKPSRSVADWGDEITLTTSYVKYTTRIKSTATADGGTLSFSFSNAIGDVTLTNVKLETGMNPTDWSPAPGDYITQASLVRNWTTNTTWINGGKIYTGSITADKIAANSITADKIATDAIKSRNYISSGGTQGSFLNLSDGSFQSPNLSWDANGNLIATNANLSGEITATEGTIGKYEITDQWLTTGSGSTCTGIGGNQAFWAGAEDSNSAPFRVGYDGKLTSSNADITGTITATNGKIGRYDITSTYLMTNSGSNASGIGGNQAFWAGAEDSNSAPFRVGYDGVLWAENAAIRGSIETGNLGDEGDTVSIINGHIGIQGTSNNVEIYSTGFKFGIDGDYYLESVSEGVKCYRNLYATDFIADGWIYNASGGHYTWKDRDDAYISCGDYNGHNVYYYANYHAFYVNKDSGQGMMYINTNGVTSRVGFTKTSDERIKKNFESFDDNIIDAYMNIEPVKYQLKQSSNDKYHFGFKAQHVDKVFSDYGDTYNESFDICTSRPIDPDKAKELYGVDDMTEEYGLRYDELIAPTTYMVQHTYKELESTKNELEQVKQEKADLETRLQAIEAKLGL